MTWHAEDPDFDRLVIDWLERDPLRAPEAMLDFVLAGFPSIPQRHRGFEWHGFLSTRIARSAIAATTVVAVIAVALVSVARPAPLPVGGQTSSPLSATIGTTWNKVGGGTALTIQHEPSDTGSYYWRVATYDVIEAHGWTNSQTVATDRAAGSRLLSGMADDVAATGRRSVTFTVTPGTFRDSLIVSPATPIQVDQNVTVQTVGTAGYFASAERQGSGSYTITALVGQPADAAGHLDVAALRASGSNYPADVLDRYSQVGSGIIGPNAKALEDGIVAKVGRNAAPIDIALAMMAELRSTKFTYSTDLSRLPCQKLSTVECLATFKQGFCQYYATTMAALLRDLGIPTRIVEGFLPGQRIGRDEAILQTNAFSWVEVYFAGFGWVQFDPTAGSVTRLVPASVPSGG